MGSRADIFLARPEQEDEQRLREVVCERRGVGVRCHDPPHDEAACPCLRPFHTVSPRTGVKIVSAVALFHSFGVARQGPWITWVHKGKRKGQGWNPRLFLISTKHSYCPGGGPRTSTPYRAAMAAICSISASSGSSSGWGGTVSALAGSPVSPIRPSQPAGVKRNNSLAGPKSTVKA